MMVVIAFFYFHSHSHAVSFAVVQLVKFYCRNQNSPDKYDSIPVG